MNDMENGRMIVAGMQASLEEMWAMLDRMFDRLTDEDWQLAHGPDWIFADLPFHLAYIDWECVAEPIKLGRELPPEKQVKLSSINELNAWNQEHFKQRPADQTVAESLAQMHASRDTVRKIADDMTDADLMKPAWFPLLTMRGFRTAQVALGFCVNHTWGHLEEARVRLGYSASDIAPAVRPAMIDGRINMFHAAFIDPAAAQDADFTLVTDIVGVGGGAWTTHIAEGAATVAPGFTEGAELVISQGVDSYIKQAFLMANMPTLIQSGEVEVSDFDALATFGSFFLLPDPDAIMDALPE
jgi:hypothetical protein